MSPAGRTLMIVALGASVPGAMLGALSLVLSDRPSARLARLATVGLQISAAALVAATLVLARAFAVGDYSLVAVADHSRRALGTYDRVMGLWGGMAGSLLLFTAATAAFAAVGLGRRPHRLAVTFANAVVAALIATGWLLADPFRTLEIPALDGAGLTPILEHWAMRIHPPLVYAGLTILVVPAARTLAALWDRTLDRTWWRDIHPWLLASWGLLGFGMIIGSHWAYVELGWGGYWAWDPVENAALLPWLAITVALHGDHERRPVLLAAAAIAPFGLALLGSAVTRSGATTSVHAFAEARSIGRALTVLLAVVVLASVALVVTVRRGPVVARTDRWPPVAAQAITVTVLAVVLVGTLYPLLRAWFGGDRLAVAGHFYTGTIGPVMLLGLAALAARARPLAPWTVGTAVVVAAALVLAGWRQPFPIVLAATAAAALVAGVSTIVRTRRLVELAHVGLAIFLIGAAGTATGDQRVETVGLGDEIRVSGHVVRVDSIGTEPGPTEASTAVVARLSIDGHLRTAALVAHPDRGVLLAESTLRSTPLADVQVILRDATDDSALLMVNVAPLQQVVWWGALTMIAGGVAGSVRRQTPDPRPQASGGRSSSRRARFDASNEPSVDAGGSSADVSTGSTASGAGPDGVDRSAATSGSLEERR